MKQMPVIIVGAGGHGKVVCDALLASGREVLGFVDTLKEAGTLIYCGVAVLGTDTIIEAMGNSAVELANGIGMLPRSSLRREVYANWKKKGYKFTTVIHPTTYLANDVLLEEGAQIMVGAVLQPSVKIGQNTIVNTGVLIDHDCTVKRGCHLAPGVVVSGNVSVEDNVHVGTGARVIQGVTIHEDSVVGAGAVVVKDVEPNMMVAGIPAKSLSWDKKEICHEP